ncbi:hypothetical protein BJ742DRAFT_866732 [Cladochytrium replicatum]|nr:hypothetical protein BJ742DRAFT_866732 [Cladochytrium replicatum]
MEPAHCHVVKANDVAQQFINELREHVSKLPDPPILVGFLANSDPAARKYAEWTGRTCKGEQARFVVCLPPNLTRVENQETGIVFELREVPRMDLEDAITEANEDKKVSGIMVYYPVFGNSQDQYLMNIVSVHKDVEGLCQTYRQNMYQNKRFLDDALTQKCIIPCTPLGIIKILEYIGVYNKILGEGDRLHGKVVTVVNRSEVVGRPLAALLANDGAKVFSVDEYGVMEFHRGTGLRLRKHEVRECDLTVEEALARSDVVISGVPSKIYKVPIAPLKDGVVAINFSTNNNFVEEEIKTRASIYVPSVGKVTVAMLQRNLLRLKTHQLR